MSRYLGIGKQSAWGTATSPTEWLDPISIDVKTEKEPLQLRTISSRLVQQFLEGKIVVTGDIEAPANPEAIGLLLLATFGNVSSTAQTASTKHEFTPKTKYDEIPPFLTLEIGSDNVYRKVLDVIGASLAIEFPPGEIVSCRFSILGSKEESSAEQSPSFPTVRPFTANDAIITLGGASAELRALSIEFNNNPRSDHHVIGNRYLPRHELGDLEVTGSMDLIFDSRDELDDFLNDTETSLTIDLVGPEIASGENYELKIELPVIIYSAWGAPVRTGEQIIQSIDFVARKPDSGDIKVTLVNTIESY
ncbi:MAG: phage tail tube protein [Candidatus Methanospirareceae archaeon]